MSIGSIAGAVAALVAVIALLRLLQAAIGRGWLPLAAVSATDERNRPVIVHVLRMDTRRRLHVIRCRDRHVLILTGGRDDVVVGWLPGEAP